MYLVYITAASNGKVLLEVFYNSECVYRKIKNFSRQTKELIYLSALKYLLKEFTFDISRHVVFYTTKEIAEHANLAVINDRQLPEWNPVIEKLKAFEHVPVFFSGSKRTKEFTKKLSANHIQ